MITDQNNPMQQQVKPRTDPRLTDYRMHRASLRADHISLGASFGVAARPGMLHQGVDKEEYVEMCSRFEEFFALYLTDLPPIGDLENDSRGEDVKSAVRTLAMLIRSVREFVIAQMSIHLASRSRYDDAFFVPHQIPLLAPLKSIDFEAAQILTFDQYWERLNHHFPDFTRETDLAFPSPQVAQLFTVAVGPEVTYEHFLIMPDGQELLNYLIEAQKNIPMRPAL